jgi:hypothetical protein
MHLLDFAAVVFAAATVGNRSYRICDLHRPREHAWRQVYVFAKCPYSADRFSLPGCMVLFGCFVCAVDADASSPGLRVTMRSTGGLGLPVDEARSWARRPVNASVTPLKSMPEYNVNLSDVGSNEELVAAFNASLFKYGGGCWQTLNLDAFNDYLDWLEPKYRLTLTGWNDCNVLDTIHGPSRRSLRDVMLEIFADHPDIDLHLS